MTEHGEEALALLVVPHLDLVIVSSGHEEGLGAVEVNTSHRAVMLVKLLDKSLQEITN